MLYALRHPLDLGALAIGFLVAFSVHALVRGQLARWTGQTGALSRPIGARDPRHQIDPFGLVALVLAGVGWLRPLEPTGRWRARPLRRVSLAVSGPIANLIVGAAAFIGFRAFGGSAGLADARLAEALSAHSELQGELFGSHLQQLLLALAIANLALGVLSLLPIPPLEGGDVLFSFAPPSRNWQRLRYHLAEQNWGVAVVLLLLLLPIAGNAPPLLALIDVVVHAILGGLNQIAI